MRSYHHGSLRAALLQASETILDRDGIAALTLRAAAREAGVSHAAPTHHFGDLGGLLTALAAAGFERFRGAMQAELGSAGPEQGARLLALGRGYVGFARACPGLFQLMFRSERLDWSSEALSKAADAAFAMLTQDGQAGHPPDMVIAMTRWSLVHGLATLLIDGRLEATMQKGPGRSLETLIEGVLSRFVQGEFQTT
nr:TetR-like C-terminal domain-containing protein [uncultured Lichenicoccus sp.]